MNADGTTTVEVIFVDGRRESHDLFPSRVAGEVRRLIGSEGLDVVNLQDGRCMYVDDTGMLDGREPNAEATRLYHTVCFPGTTRQIHGDVAIVIDRDLA